MRPVADCVDLKTVLLAETVLHEYHDYLLAYVTEGRSSPDTSPFSPPAPAGLLSWLNRTSTVLFGSYDSGEGYHEGAVGKYSYEVGAATVGWVAADDYKQFEESTILPGFLGPNEEPS